MAKPSDHSQQRARNAMRGELEVVAGATRCNLKSLLSASRAPEGLLCTAEADVLEKFDSVMSTLEKLRKETVAEFQMCKEEEARLREASESATIALQPSIDCLDCFMRQVAKEVDDETTEAIQVHTEKLEELQREQIRFVNANDSPQRNQIFAKVIEDLTCTERVREEHIEQRASYKGLLKDWEEVLEKIPIRKQPAPAPRKRTFLDCILGRL